jgi:micrococcal nuclease
LLSQVAVGDAVTLETDVQEQDQYGRTLAHVKRANGDYVNEQMLRAGYAVVLVYPPNVRHVERYRAVQDSARVAKRGLWERSGFECLPVDRRRRRC